MKHFGVLLLLLVPVTCLQAQFSQSKDYRKQSEEIRKEVWAWKHPQFAVREIPQQFANTSKVIIARRTELTTDSKSGISFHGFGFLGKKELTINEVAREVIKLNDKKAIEEYSEISFTQFAKKSGFSSSEITTYIGIRIIKKDGKVTEINGDDIVLTKETKTEKKAKIAVPDLQPGDVLDYFIATSQELVNTQNNPAYKVSLFDDAPIMHLSFHAQLGKKYAIDYRSYNGAPELKVSKNDEKEIIVDVEQKNIAAYETSLWVSEERQLPFIRMFISLGYRGPGAKALNVSPPGEVTKNIGGEAALDDLAGKLSLDYYNGYWMRTSKEIYKTWVSNAKSRAKQMGLSFKDLSDEEKATLLFYSFRFDFFLSFNINYLEQTINRGNAQYNGLAMHLYCLMKEADLNPAILASESRTGYGFKETMHPDDFVKTAYLPQGANKFFRIESIFSIPFTIPQDIEGANQTRSITFEHPWAILGINRAAGLTNIGPGSKVPVSPSEKNLHLEKLTLSLTPDYSQLAVKRRTLLKGHYKAAAQSGLMLYEDYYEAERLALKEEKSLMELLDDARKTRKYADEVKNSFAEARKKQNAAFITEAADWFEQEVTNLSNNKIENMGIRHTAPDFVYSSSFNLAGLVKKGGNNIILEIGKIQGQPLLINDEQRKRAFDAYMPFARGLEYEIELEIPNGYTVEGVSALNVNVTNESGFFKVEAANTDKLVTIKIKKHYLHNYEPAKQFGKLLEFMDAANAWTNAKLLFKKK